MELDILVGQTLMTVGKGLQVTRTMVEYFLVASVLLSNLDGFLTLSGRMKLLQLIIGLILLLYLVELLLERILIAYPILYIPCKDESIAVIDRTFIM